MTEKEFLELILEEISTAEYGEGLAFNLPFITEKIMKRIIELENE